MTKPNISSSEPAVSFTLRKAPYSYFHLSLRSLIATSQAPHDLDEISVRSYLTLALQQYLGLSGTAISIDILKVEGRDVWIRVPSEDEVALAASLSQWTGSKDLAWRIEQRGAWLGALVGNTNAQKLWTMDS
jgi:ribonuclease P/MRP protein subunit POP8